MTIFDSTRRNVNPARKPFGRGILASRPSHRDEVSQADREWAAYHLNADCTDYDSARDWDQEAGEAEAQARMDAGIPLF